MGRRHEHSFAHTYPKHVPSNLKACWHCRRNTTLFFLLRPCFACSTHVTCSGSAAELHLDARPQQSSHRGKSSPRSTIRKVMASSRFCFCSNPTQPSLQTPTCSRVTRRHTFSSTTPFCHPPTIRQHPTRPYNPSFPKNSPPLISIPLSFAVCHTVISPPSLPTLLYKEKGASSVASPHFPEEEGFFLLLLLQETLSKKSGRKSSSTHRPPNPVAKGRFYPSSSFSSFPFNVSFFPQTVHRHLSPAPSFNGIANAHIPVYTFWVCRNKEIVVFRYFW